MYRLCRDIPRYSRGTKKSDTQWAVVNTNEDKGFTTTCISILQSNCLLKPEYVSSVGIPLVFFVGSNSIETRINLIYRDQIYI